MPLNWKGKRVEADVIRVLSLGLGDIGLDMEAEAKKQLYPGHGVLTGTLRRSIHAASGDHNFAAEAEGQEQGGHAPEPSRQGDRLVIAVGSGLVYAMAVHQGHHSFEGYHYLTNALDIVRARALDHVKRRAGG